MSDAERNTEANPKRIKDWCWKCHGLGAVRRKRPWPLAGVLYPMSWAYLRTCPHCNGTGFEP